MNKEKLLVVIDMNNGFAKEGNLFSPNVEKLIMPTREFVLNFKNSGGKVAYYSDSHEIDDEEFKIYPVHCLKGSHESEYVDELKNLEDYYIEKDTTDGFYAKNPFELLHNGGNGEIYVCGCVTDICVYNLVYSLLGFLKQNNLGTQVYVLEDLVATFDGPLNDAKARHKEALYQLYNEGANIISSKQALYKTKKR